MSFNVDKCVLLRFTQSHSPIINDYFLNNQAIQCSNVYKYLGIQLANTLSWDTHITTIVNKATRMLNFIKRNLSKCCCSIKSITYTTLVRPVLEYATEVWDPHYSVLSTRSRWWRDVRQDGCFQIIDSKAVLLQ